MTPAFHFLLLTLSIGLIDQTLGRPYDGPKEPPPVLLVDDCPEGWHGYLLSCYKFGLDYVTQAGAKAACKELASSLVAIETEDENDFLGRKISDIYYTNTPWRRRDGYEQWWTGGVRDGDGWAWEDSTSGEKTPVTYTDWHDPEPNGASRGEDFLTLVFNRNRSYSKQTIGWNDNDGSESSTHRFICEMDPITWPLLQ
ncbi:C-type lectin lectoxin-Phi1-like [Lingula anatina]|uniref:C-type lectin lectoxin-Phi1 n=1 Tax=Lingula anatina TaxID=7574 RepID=A0A1S3JMS3_LINAN|nr:C-type lectin lectoxin-Phi1 [Lingula anatina]XP_013411685.1 C-type lectin lectoxin-Phi1-like [Lingula anatina]|eukprot:XP_013408863.1 C-type lectin lectoxin-Phi1 [Lingula anatina]